jgi:hypothetical protein
MGPPLGRTFDPDKDAYHPNRTDGYTEVLASVFSEVVTHPRLHPACPSRSSLFYPIGDGPEAFPPQLACADATVLDGSDQARRLEDPEVLADGCERDRESSRDLAR